MHASRMLLAVSFAWGGVAVADTGTESCSNLRLLELEARQGRLDDAAISCLSRKWDAASRVGRSEISKVLMTDADTKGDVPEFERLVEQHVHLVDPRDPEVAWRWVNVLASHPERVEELLVATEVAESVGGDWPETVRLIRLARVHELRAEASLRQWQAIGPDDKRSQRRARKASRAWSLFLLDHSSAGSPSRAVDLCIEAGGTLDYCVGGEAYRNLTRG